VVVGVVEGRSLNGRGTRRHSAVADLEPHARKTGVVERRVADLIPNSCAGSSPRPRDDVVPSGELSRFLTTATGSSVFRFLSSGGRTRDHQRGTRAKSGVEGYPATLALDPPVLTVVLVQVLLVSFL
jgi:hypothetical protein